MEAQLFVIHVDSQLLVSTEYNVVSRTAMSSLKPTKWIHSDVSLVIYKTYLSFENLLVYGSLQFDVLVVNYMLDIRLSACMLSIGQWKSCEITQLDHGSGSCLFTSR